VLAGRLDGLPLALATAGAYLHQVTTSVANYLRLYDASWLRLQQTTPQLLSYEDRALYSTWNISLDHVKQQSELAAKLLQLWAYFDNQDVWLELLQEGQQDGPAWLSALTEDQISFDAAMRVLCDHALAEADAAVLDSRGESLGYSMHSCVHSWTVHVLNQEWDAALGGLALECVGRHVPDSNQRDALATERRLIRHAARSWECVVDGNVDSRGREDYLCRLGNMFANQEQHIKAEKMYQRALQGFEKTLGPNHTLTLQAVSNLGSSYACQDMLAEAEKMYERALRGFEKAFESKLILETINNLGGLYKNQGKLSEAEEMYLRALRGMEEALGPNHTSTLRTVNNLGLLYKDQDKLAEAEKMYERALQGKEEALGPNHMSTLHTVNYLGDLYESQGKLVEAEKMYERALQGREDTFGPYHTFTLDSIRSLAVILRDQGKLVQAEEMYKRALRGFEKALGPNHMSTLGMVNNLGTLYHRQGRLADAEKMYERALQGYEKALGPNHTSTLLPVFNLSSIYEAQGKLMEAEKLFERAMCGFEAHDDTDSTTNDV
jgi:tetratricopeptide (TPR) repeat protein